MKYVQKLNKSFSKLGFGGAALSGAGRGYGFGEIGEKVCLRLCEYALDEVGINIFDFAPIYGHNLAEKRMGMALKGRREKAYLVSKSGVTWHDSGRVNMTNDPKIALKMLDQTLKNFDSDYVDIYLVHWPDKKVDIRFALEALYGAKVKGKISHLGLCNTNPEDLSRAKEVAPIEVVQMEANLFNQEAFDQISSSLSEDVYKMGWGSYDKGLLAGSVYKERKFETDDCRSWAPWWKKGNWKEKADFIERYKSDSGIEANELASHALSYAASVADTALCGAKSIEQIDLNVSRLQSSTDFEKTKNVFASF